MGGDVLISDGLLLSRLLQRGTLLLTILVKLAAEVL